MYKILKIGDISFEHNLLYMDGWVFDDTETDQTVVRVPMRGCHFFIRNMHHVTFSGNRARAHHFTIDQLRRISQTFSNN